MDDGFTGTEMSMPKWLGGNTIIIILGLLILIVLIYIMYKKYTGIFG